MSAIARNPAMTALGELEDKRTVLWLCDLDPRLLDAAILLTKSKQLEGAVFDTDRLACACSALASVDSTS